MSTSYTAVLLYGFLMDTSEFMSENDFWDWEPWLAEKLEVPVYTKEYKAAVEALGIGIMTRHFYNEADTHYLALKSSIQTCDCWETHYFDILPIMVLDKTILKTACEKLGIEYHEPTWVLFVDIL